MRDNFTRLLVLCDYTSPNPSHPSTAFRRIAENVASVPLGNSGFIPVALGSHELYHWLHEGVMEADPILAGKQAISTSRFVRRRLFVTLVRDGDLLSPTECTSRR